MLLCCCLGLKAKMELLVASLSVTALFSRLVPTQDIKMATASLGLTLKVKIWQGRERISLLEVPEEVSVLLIDSK